MFITAGSSAGGLNSNIRLSQLNSDAGGPNNATHTCVIMHNSSQPAHWAGGLNSRARFVTASHGCWRSKHSELTVSSTCSFSNCSHSQVITALLLKLSTGGLQGEDSGSWDGFNCHPTLNPNLEEQQIRHRQQSLIWRSELVCKGSQTQLRNLIYTTVKHT